MRIIINDLHHAGDVLAAIAAITATLSDPAGWEVDEHVFSKVGDESATADPTPAWEQQVVVQVDDAIGTCRLVPCRHRGQHHRLVDCWMCWSDVHRGAIRLDQAVSNAD